MAAEAARDYRSGMNFATGGTLFALAVILFAGGLPTASGATPSLVALTVDATDAPRGVLHAHITLPAAPGEQVLAFPKWIPGEHQPADRSQISSTYASPPTASRSRGGATARASTSCASRFRAAHRRST
jgi:hypothetical protein